jgi:hypothetical protein
VAKGFAPLNEFNPAKKYPFVLWLCLPNGRALRSSPNRKSTPMLPLIREVVVKTATVTSVATVRDFFDFQTILGEPF